MRIDGPGLIRLLERAASVEAFEESVARHYFAGPSVRDVVDFLEVPSVSAFDLPPQRAIEYFKAKRLRPTFSYADMIGDAHAQAFTVAKMMDVDLLGQMRASLDDALANGVPFKEWADSIMPRLQAAGWWGRKEVVDPVTGQTVVARLGTPARLETIFRTNLQSAYAAGQWTEIERNADVAPFLLYDAVDDFRTRDLHRSWDQTVLPVNDPWWTSHYPPNGYNCRCGVIQLDAEEVEALGLKVAIEAPNDGVYKWKNPRTGDVFYIPEGIDPGFDWNVGQTFARLSKTLDEKIDALPDTAREAAKVAASQMRAQIAASKQAQDELDSASDAARAATIEAQNRANATAEAAIARAKAIADEKAKQAAAAAQLQAIKTGKGGAGIYGKNAYTALAKVPGFLSGLPTEQLDVVLAKAKQLAGAAQQAKALSGYEKSVVAGKLPTKVQAAAFNALSDADKAPILAKIQKAKEAEQAFKAALAKTAADDAAAKAQAAAQAQAQAAAQEAAQQAAKAPEKASDTAAAVASAGTPPDTRKLVQVGPQQGSNEGGTYQDSATGVRWYVKIPRSESHARNEILASKLYELAGVDVPELHLVKMPDGRTAVASRIVDGLRKATSPSQLSVAGGTAEGFATDAWLANWDVVGLSFDNLLLKGGKAIRIDVGGSLLFRAQGGAKGSSFGNDVVELKTLLDPSKSPQAAKVFASLPGDPLAAGIKRVIGLSDADIRATVESFGPGTAQERAALAEQLIARRNFIAKQYPSLAPPDAEAIAEAVAEATDEVKQAIAETDDTILSAIKGIASRAAKGAALEQKDIDRAGAALKAVAKLQEKLALATAEYRSAAVAYYGPIAADLLSLTSAGAGSPAKWSGFKFSTFSGKIEIDRTLVKPKPKPAPGSTIPLAEGKKILDAAGAANYSVPRVIPENMKALHEAHVRAIVAYSGSFYSGVNRGLRKAKATAEQKAYARLLNEALALSSKYVGQVRRGLSLDGSELEEFAAQHKEAFDTASIISYPAFTSTSRKSGFSGNVRCVIQSKTGVLIRQVSLHSGEDEVLIPAGARFKVTRFVRSGRDIQIDLEEI